MKGSREINISQKRKKSFLICLGWKYEDNYYLFPRLDQTTLKRSGNLISKFIQIFEYLNEL